MKQQEEQEINVQEPEKRLQLTGKQWIIRWAIYLTGMVVLAFGITLNTKTGLGVVLSVNMRLVPNPGDGIVQAISDQTGKSLGLTKNLFDVGCILCSVAIGLIFAGRLVGIGIGTLLAVLGVGRAVALFNLLLRNKMLRAAGLEKK